jgi:preprotein translocase subunit SecF
MELFRDTHYDFLGRKWWFILPSLVLLAAGCVSLFLQGGPQYGIDFTGGAVMDVRWNGTPPIERIRAAVASQVKDASVVAAHDRFGSNDVLVSAPCPDGADLMALRETIGQSLATVDPGYTVRSFEAIGPQIGADLRKQALAAAGGATGGMLLYLAWRFRTTYGLAAVAAMVHDAVITVGLLSLLHQDITITVVAALLTLIGYSMNDTIVVFDRVRENRRRNEREPLAATINRSINQTLSRTILTSGLTLVAALSLLLFGGPVLRGFSLTLVIGIVVGTFSSIFIASPLLLAWEERRARWSVEHAPALAGGVR